MSTLWLDSMSTALTRERARVVRFRARLGVPRHAACTRGRNRATRARLRLSAVGRRARRGLDGWQWVWLLITADQTLNVRPRRYRDTQRPHATRHAVLEQPFRRSNSSRPPANAAVGGGGEARQHATSVGARTVQWSERDLRYQATQRPHADARDALARCYDGAAMRVRRLKQVCYIDKALVRAAIIFLSTSGASQRDAARRCRLHDSANASGCVSTSGPRASKSVTASACSEEQHLRRRRTASEGFLV